MDAPAIDVVIGSGNPVELVAPVSLNVARVSLDCSELVVVPSDHTSAMEGNSVTIEAAELLERRFVSTPIVRKGAILSVSWPGATAYPWTSFAADSKGSNSKDIDDALRALRRLVIAFRSHSRGRLGRIEDKIEHRRVTKGAVGVAIRQRLMDDGVLTREGSMYFLNPDALGRVVGATYQDMSLKVFNDRVRQYVLSVLR